MIIKENREIKVLSEILDGGVFYCDMDYFIKVNSHSHFNGACEHGKCYAVRLRDGYVLMIANDKLVDDVKAALVIDGEE